MERGCRICAARIAFSASCIRIGDAFMSSPVPHRSPKRQVIVLFRFLHDKDVFEAYYKAHLQKRLLSACLGWWGRFEETDACAALVVQTRCVARVRMRSCVCTPKRRGEGGAVLQAYCSVLRV